MSFRITPSSDASVVVEFGDRMDIELNNQVLRAHTAVKQAALAGVIESVPTFRSLMVHYDPLVTSMTELTDRLESLVQEGAETTMSSRLWRLPVCYHSSFAEDLDDVARSTGLTTKEVVELHAGETYHVYMIGFLPGYPYMGDLPGAIQLPRRIDPRVRVPRGAVAIATSMTSVYPFEVPGGWHLIGSMPIPLFDATKPEPVLLAAGDHVRFEPVSLSEYQALQVAIASGRHSPTCEALTS